MGPVASVFVERSTRESLGGFLVPWHEDFYDSQGRMIRSVIFNEDGTVSNTWTYAYFNDDNKRSNAAVYGSKNELRWKETYRYDEQRLLRETVFEGPDKVVTHKLLFKYDDLGRKIEVVNIDNSGRQYTKESYKYDSTNQTVEQLTYASNVGPVYRVVYSYGPRGNVESMLEYSETGALAHHWIYHYRYDSRGNWVERTGTDQHKTGTSRDRNTVERIRQRFTYTRQR
jgi:YD repeat-containing protein